MLHQVDIVKYSDSIALIVDSFDDCISLAGDINNFRFRASLQEGAERKSIVELPAHCAFVIDGEGFSQPGSGIPRPVLDGRKFSLVQQKPLKKKSADS